MLSRKQSWMRCRRTSKSVLSRDDFECLPGKTPSKGLHCTRSQSWSNQVTVNSGISNTQVMAGKEEKTVKRNVQFTPMVKVVLIPALGDFTPDIKKLCWYTGVELNQMKVDAFNVWKVYGIVGVIQQELDAYEEEIAVRASPAKIESGQTQAIPIKKSEQLERQQGQEYLCRQQELRQQQLRQHGLRSVTARISKLSAGEYSNCQQYEEDDDDDDMPSAATEQNPLYLPHSCAAEDRMKQRSLMFTSHSYHGRMSPLQVILSTHANMSL